MEDIVKTLDVKFGIRKTPTHQTPPWKISPREGKGIFQGGVWWVRIFQRKNFPRTMRFKLLTVINRDYEAMLERDQEREYTQRVKHILKILEEI